MWQDQTWRTSMKARGNLCASASPLPDIGRGCLVDLAIFEHSVFQLEGTRRIGLSGWFNKLYWHRTHSPPFPSAGVSAWQPKHWVATLSFTPARSTLPDGSRRYLKLKAFATIQVRLLNVGICWGLLPPSVPWSNPAPLLDYLGWFTPSMNLHEYRKSPATVLKICCPDISFLHEKQNLAELIRGVNNILAKVRKRRVQDLASASRIFCVRQSSKQAS